MLRILNPKQSEKSPKEGKIIIFSHNFACMINSQSLLNHNDYNSVITINI